ncbi:MAG: tyrosine-protein phosphatase [Inhella sp.]
MKLRALPLPANVRGRLWLSAMPGTQGSWADFERSASAAGLTRIVCLTPLTEITARSPTYLKAIEQDRLPCAIELMAMANFGVGEDAQTFAQQVRALAERLRDGESLLLHCAWGIGRTGTVAACLLKALGLSATDAMAQVQAAGSNPQSALQSGWVDAF